MMPRGFLKYLVLKLINDEPKHGYEIMSEIERKTKGFWRPSPGSIYPLLSSLENDKCIELEEKESSEADEKEGERRRKIYRITEKGLEELNQCMKELNEFIASRSYCLPPWANFFKELFEIDTSSNTQKTTTPTKVKGEEELGQINYCPYCGTEIKHPNAKFCPNCGEKIAL